MLQHVYRRKFWLYRATHGFANELAVLIDRRPMAASLPFAFATHLSVWLAVAPFFFPSPSFPPSSSPFFLPAASSQTSTTGEGGCEQCNKRQHTFSLPHLSIVLSCSHFGAILFLLPRSKISTKFLHFRGNETRRNDICNNLTTS